MQGLDRTQAGLGAGHTEVDRSFEEVLGRAGSLRWEEVRSRAVRRAVAGILPAADRTEVAAVAGSLDTLVEAGSLSQEDSHHSKT